MLKFKMRKKSLQDLLGFYRIGVLMYYLQSGSSVHFGVIEIFSLKNRIKPNYLFVIVFLIDIHDDKELENITKFHEEGIKELTELDENFAVSVDISFLSDHFLFPFLYDKFVFLVKFVELLFFINEAWILLQALLSKMIVLKYFLLPFLVFVF